MAVRWQDVSMPLREGMAVWPGDAPFEWRPANRIAAGDGCNTSVLHMAAHTGTHVDAPWHFEEDGPRLDEVDPQVFFGSALVVEVSRADGIGVEDLPPGPLPARILFKTRNSEFSLDAPFQGDFAAVRADAAQRLVDAGVRLVGVDYLSVAPYHQPGGRTHHVLLGAGVLVVEGLRFAGVSAGIWEFVVLPLAVAGADGAPCRAFIGREEGNE